MEVNSVRRERPEQVVRMTAEERRFLVGLIRCGGRQGVALRAAALLLSAEGQSAAQVGKPLGVAPRAVHAWRRRWREEGAQTLEARAHPGRPSRLTPSAVELLLKEVKSDPREQGTPSHAGRARVLLHTLSSTQACTSARLGERGAAAPWLRLATHKADAEEAGGRGGACSGACRAPIPGQAEQRLRSKVSAGSGEAAHPR